MFTNFTEVELTALITNQVEENLHLDYKAAGSLGKNDQKKREIAKDVSSFANSDGGIIVYGLKEYDEAPKKHLPERIDAIDRTSISKEWLEQVINSNIQPKIPGLLINPIQLDSSINNVVYVVTIPKSNTAHQASDKKYYKRYNFESVAMEDYEIKDIINRQVSPDLMLLLQPDNTKIEGGTLTFPIMLMNRSIKMADKVKFTIQIEEPENCDVVSLVDLVDLSHLNIGKKIYGSGYDISVYNGLNIRVGQLSLKPKEGVNKLSFTSAVFADNMQPIIDKFDIEIVDGSPKYLIK